MHVSLCGLLRLWLVALPSETLSRLFQLVQFVKCWHFFLELISKRLHQRKRKEKESLCFCVHVLQKR